MTEVKTINADILSSYEMPENMVELDRLLFEAVSKDKHKIIVLDDDPTGVQTVHDVSVYTNWDYESIKQGFEENNKIFYILTNSRAFTAEQTKEVHEKIGATIAKVACELNCPYMIISRSDSTLRGHYPLETEILRQQMKLYSNEDVDGEILCPYFKEGGRFTLNNIHYVKYENKLVPAGEDPTGHRVVDYTYRDFGMGTEWVIAGVVDDFRNRSLTDKITPAAFLLHDGIPSESHVLCVRLTDEKAAGKVLPRLRAKWEEIYPGKPFVYKDVEQMFVGMSGDVISFSRILLVYAVISLLLTLFGLFGIVRYAVRIRLREIGIRKIHGASACRILWILSRPFMVYLGLAFVLAFPFTLYGMNIWLEQFRYRAPVTVADFLLPLFFVAAVTLMVVVGNGLRAARSNPVESIKRE